ncbi:hypothetical protein SLEP1_g43738 [Rubroshorea leprosula]|uniref:Uncharacterized protein n=1 Tax=Rubroshorea leprosula TaxID=152421 RepID=A0AAV5LEG7_9ROSI|nr:hypothetical protein SLEP1_g43738 [Rubroshorea leprosula]
MRNPGSALLCSSPSAALVCGCEILQISVDPPEFLLHSRRLPLTCNSGFCY